MNQYENDSVLFNELRPSEKSESIKTVTKGSNTDVVAREIRAYTIEEHFKPQWEKARLLYDRLSQQVLELDPRIEMHPVKNYIGFNIEGKNVALVKIRQSKILLELLRTQPQDLNDVGKRTRYMEHSFERFNQYVTQFDIETEDDIDYAMMLVKQVYKRFVE